MGRVSLSRKLVRCARDGDVAGVERSIAEGADVNFIGARGCTAAHFAAVWGRPEILVPILRTGRFDPAVRATKGGLTAFEEAMEQAPAMARQFPELAASFMAVAKMLWDYEKRGTIPTSDSEFTWWEADQEQARVADDPGCWPSP